MFDVFGDFNSYEEINESAAGLKAEGDLENIKVLAKENGLDESVAEMFVSGECEVLVDAFGAAMGKLLVEKREINNKNMPVDPIVDYLLSECLDDEFASVGDCTEKILAEEERLIQKLEDQLPQWDSTGTILGNGIGEGVIKGIEDSNYQVQQAMKAQARKALEAAKKELDVNSPSKKARKLYHSVGEGSAKGLEDGEGMVESAARKVANASLKGLATANNTVKSTSSTAKSATTTMSQVQYSSEVAKAIKTVFEGMSIELGEQQVGKFVDTRLRRMN